MTYCPCSRCNRKRQVRWWLSVAVYTLLIASGLVMIHRVAAGYPVMRGQFWERVIG